MDSTIERLYKDDVNKRKQNQHVLKTIFTPSFTPQTNKAKNIKQEPIHVPKEDFDEENEEIDDNNLIIGNECQIENVIRDKLFKNKKITSNKTEDVTENNVSENKFDSSKEI